MKFQLAFASVICVLLASYINMTSSIDKKSKQENSTRVEPVDYVMPTEKEKDFGNNPQQWNSNLQQAIAIKRGSKRLDNSYSNPDQYIEQRPINSNFNLRTDYYPNISQSVISLNYMSLTPTGQVNQLDNPLYKLSLYVNGQLLKNYSTVTGRADSQYQDRHKSGTKAPLPDGNYRVSFVSVAGSHSETGGSFLPIQPLFPTNRSNLGIHYDPSFEKSNGEDGTSGCIALTNKSDFDEVVNYVYTYRPQYLRVEIQ